MSMTAEGVRLQSGPRLYVPAQGADGCWRYQARMRLGKLLLVGVSGGFLSEAEALASAARDAARDPFAEPSTVEALA